MAFQTIAPFAFSVQPYRNSATPTFADSAVMTGTGNKICAMFSAPFTGNITDIGFRVNTLTTGGSVDVRLETIDLATGFPSGTLWGTNTNKVVDISGGAGHYRANLTAGASVTKGDLLALVIVGTTSGVAPVYALTNFQDGNMNGTPDFPIYGTFAAGSWTAVVSCITASIEYSGVCYPINHLWPLSGVGTQAYNNTLTPDVYANKFSIPVPLRFTGCAVWADWDGDVVIKLYDSDGVTVLSSLTIDKDIPGAATGSGMQFLDMPPVYLNKNTNYYLGVEPSTATSPTIYYMDVNNAYVFNQIHGTMSCFLSTAKDPSGVGSWTDTTTRKLWLEPRFDGILDGASPLLVDGGLVQ